MHPEAGPDTAAEKSHSKFAICCELVMQIQQFVRARLELAWRISDFLSYFGEDAVGPLDEGVYGTWMLWLDYLASERFGDQNLIRVDVFDIAMTHSMRAPNEEILDVMRNMY